MDRPWPFEDAPDTEVFTLVRILAGEAPIRLVTHDADDGAWQFLDGEAVLTSDAALAALAEIIHLDPSVHVLADLPLGWYAIRRDAGDAWDRQEGEPEG